ncbi:MAG TPA: glycosyl hydrolase [Bacteroidales bacterium]|jgi:mannan endo-1,4-beta-mannosidase|nr:glycosyl hydrolase [Bacteroidales bacterium]
MKYISILILLLFSANTFPQFQPVNPDASPEAKKLLAYLYSLQGKHTLAGQHNYNQSLNQYMDSVKSITGKFPAVWGTDFILNGTTDHGPEIVKEAVKKYNDGYIVTLMWHAGRPTDDPPYGWRESVQAELDEAQWNELTKPGTALNKRWEAQVDKIASYLKQLQDAKIPVLWRPYHEMNGVWFWWGDKKGPDGYQKLWKMMFDRFTKVHKLNNLLWVWNANAPRDIPFDQAYSYKEYYPGPEYVDVLATDVYNHDYEDRDYNELLALANGKIIALGECGELPKPEILKVQPRFSWFMVWANWIQIDNSPRRVRDIYDHPQVMTHEEVF